MYCCGIENDFLARACTQMRQGGPTGETNVDITQTRPRASRHGEGGAAMERLASGLQQGIRVLGDEPDPEVREAQLDETRLRADKLRLGALQRAEIQGLEKRLDTRGATLQKIDEHVDSMRAAEAQLSEHPPGSSGYTGAQLKLQLCTDIMSGLQKALVQPATSRRRPRTPASTPPPPRTQRRRLISSPHISPPPRSQEEDDDYDDDDDHNNYETRSHASI